jgi:cytochrome b6-f complex iron-sulfur subunit
MKQLQAVSLQQEKHYHMKRRSFIRLSWIVGAIVVFGGQVAILLKQFLTAGAPKVPTRAIDIGPQEQFATTGVTHFWKEGFLLVHQQDTFVALSQQCTHNRCKVNYVPTERVIICPCHSARFSLSGAVLRGPARRPLQRYPVTLQDGRVVVERPA